MNELCVVLTAAITLVGCGAAPSSSGDTLPSGTCRPTRARSQSVPIRSWLSRYDSFRAANAQGQRGVRSSEHELFWVCTVDVWLTTAKRSTRSADTC